MHEHLLHAAVADRLERIDADARRAAQAREALRQQRRPRRTGRSP